MFEPKQSHYFVDLDQLILKMYTVWGFEIFHKIIEENWKKILSQNELFHFHMSQQISDQRTTINIPGDRLKKNLVYRPRGGGLKKA